MKKESHKTRKKQTRPSSSTMGQTKIQKALQKECPEQNKKVMRECFEMNKETTNKHCQ